MADQDKRDKYRNIGGMVVDPDAATCNFMPFAIETSGRLGTAALQFLTKYGGFCHTSTITRNALVTSIVATIQYHNACMASYLRQHSTQCHAPMDGAAADVVG